MTLIVSTRQKDYDSLWKSKGADGLDCLYKTKDYDSIWKVKADDIDSLHKTKDSDSLWKLKEQMTLIVSIRQKTMIVFEK